MGTAVLLPPCSHRRPLLVPGFTALFPPGFAADFCFGAGFAKLPPMDCSLGVPSACPVPVFAFPAAAALSADRLALETTLAGDVSNAGDGGFGSVVDRFSPSPRMPFDPFAMAAGGDAVPWSSWVGADMDAGTRSRSTCSLSLRFAMGVLGCSATAGVEEDLRRERELRLAGDLGLVGDSMEIEPRSELRPPGLPAAEDRCPGLETLAKNPC